MANTNLTYSSADHVTGIYARRNYLKGFDGIKSIGLWGLLTSTTYSTTTGPSGIQNSGASLLALTSSTTGLTSDGCLTLTKSVGNATGQGIQTQSISFDREDAGKVINVSFNYEVTAGTVDFSGTSTQSIELWLYDPTNSGYIQPTNYRGFNQTGGPGRITATFQSAPASIGNAVSAIIFVNTTATGAFTINFSDFSMSTQTQSAPSFVISTTVNGAPANSSANGIIIWPTIVSQTSASYNVSTGQFTAPVSGFYGVSATMNTGTTNGANLEVYVNSVAKNIIGYFSASSQVSGYTIVQANAGDLLDIRCNAATTGSSGANNNNASFTLISSILSGADTQVIAAAYSASGAISWTATGGGNFDTLIYDTSASVTTGSNAWKFTAPITGKYKATLSVVISSSTQAWALYKNGSLYKYFFRVPNQAGFISNGSVEIALNAGDYIDARLDSGTALGDSNANGNVIYIERLSGPSVIAASESVNARYTGAPPTGSLGAAFNTITYGTKDFDSHNAYSSGIYMIPVSGKYQINAATRIVSTLLVNQLTAIAIYKNGTIVSQGTREAAASATAESPDVNDVVNCVAGDLITIKSYTDGSSPSYGSASQQNYFSIYRVGN